MYIYFKIIMKRCYNKYIIMLPIKLLKNIIIILTFEKIFLNILKSFENFG